MPVLNLMDVAESTVTQFRGSDMRNVCIALNNVVRALAGAGMPGFLLSDPATKQGTSSATAWRAEAFTFTFRGKQTAAAAQEKAFTATTHDVAASKEAWFVLSTQTDGTTFTITKAADQTIGTRVLPTTPDNEIAIGWLQIITGAGGIFDATTTALAAGGNVVSVTFYDAPHLFTVGEPDGTDIDADTP